LLLRDYAGLTSVAGLHTLDLRRFDTACGRVKNAAKAGKPALVDIDCFSGFFYAWFMRAEEVNHVTEGF